MGYFEDSLNEHTAGGYVYARINFSGGVEILEKFDNEVASLAIWSKIVQYAKMKDEINQELGIQSILQDISDEIVEEDEGFIDEEESDDDEDGTEKFKS